MMITEGIILAAGYSSRAKTNKMLLKLGAKTVIEHCIDSFYNSCSKIYVVLGFRGEEIIPVLKKYMNAQIIMNSHFSDGMFSSVKEGLKYIKGDQFFIIPGDYPVIKNITILKMLDREESIILPSYNGISGHPVRMKSYLIPELEKGSFGSLREFVASKNPFLLEVDDMGVIEDIDTIEDYNRILDIFRTLDQEEK